MAKKSVVVTVLFVGFVGKAVNWGETQEQKVRSNGCEKTFR